LKQLAVYGEQSGLFNPRGIAAVKHILVKAQPVKRVRSLFTVEDIKVDGDLLEIEPLITEVPSSAAGLEALKQHVLGNPLLVGVIVSADGKATNMQVELNVAEDDAPGMQAVYVAIEALLDNSGNGAQLHFSGPPMVTAQIADIIQQDNMKFFPL